MSLRLALRPRPALIDILQAEASMHAKTGGQRKQPCPTARWCCCYARNITETANVVGLLLHTILLLGQQAKPRFTREREGANACASSATRNTF